MDSAIQRLKNRALIINYNKKLFVMKILTGYNLCLLTGSLKKVKRETAMNDKKIFNICKYDDYDCVSEY